MLKSGYITAYLPAFQASKNDWATGSGETFARVCVGGGGVAVGGPSVGVGTVVLDGWGGRVGLGGRVGAAVASTAIAVAAGVGAATRATSVAGAPVDVETGNGADRPHPATNPNTTTSVPIRENALAPRGRRNATSPCHEYIEFRVVVVNKYRFD